MKMHIGTIHELTGKGLELLVDVETRSFVLATLFDGKFVTETPSLSKIEAEAQTVISVA